MQNQMDTTTDDGVKFLNLLLIPTSLLLLLLLGEYLTPFFQDLLVQLSLELENWTNHY